MNCLNVFHRRGLSLLLIGLSVVVSLCAGHVAVMAKEPQDAAQAKAKNAEARKALREQRVAVLRKKFPYVSLKPRLEYESVRAAPADDPKLGPEAAKTLKHRAIGLGFFDVRAQSLAMLHSSEVKKFIERDGFGMERRPVPSLDSIEIGAPPVPFAVRSASSADEDFAAVTLPGDQVASIDDPAWLPSAKLLSQFHVSSQWNFVSPQSLGHVVNRDAVAGFIPHAFLSSPELRHPQTTQKQHSNVWLIRRLELVSLLKHPQPVAYLSEHLPRMEELKTAKTRPLETFEQQSLKKLYDGEELVAEATLNHIRMVGAVRAAKQCMECHEVRHGELLGAFSYDLARTPPVRVQKTAPKPAT